MTGVSYTRGLEVESNSGFIILVKMQIWSLSHNRENLFKKYAEFLNK